MTPPKPKIDDDIKPLFPFSVTEAAKFLGVKPQYLYDHKDKIPHRKIANRLRFDPDQLRSYVESLPGCSLNGSGDLPKRKNGPCE